MDGNEKIKEIVEDIYEKYDKNYWILVFTQDIEFSPCIEELEGNYGPIKFPIKRYRNFDITVTDGKYVGDFPSWIEKTIPIDFDKIDDKPIDFGEIDDNINLSNEALYDMNVLMEIMKEFGWETYTDGFYTKATYSTEEYIEILICKKRKIKRTSREDKIRKAKELILSKGYTLEMGKPPYEDVPLTDVGCCFYDNYTLLFGVDDEGERRFEVCMNLFEPETSPWHCTYCSEIESDRMSKMTNQCLCGYESPYGERFCCRCGKPIIIKCPICQCGTMFKKGANFCHMCGRER